MIHTSVERKETIKKMSYRIWKLLRKKWKYSFHFKIYKDPNRPELQETRVNRIKHRADKLDLVCEIKEYEDFVSIWVKTNESFKKITFKFFVYDLLRVSEFVKGYEVKPTGN